MKRKNHYSTKHFSVKSAIAIMLAIVISFSCLSISIFAGNVKPNTSTSEISSENISFNVTYPEIGKAIKVIVPGRESETFLYKWYINNTQINDFTDTYTPVEDDMEKMLTVKVYDTNAGLVGVKNMFISNIPVVYIETENREAIVSKETRLQAKMNIQGNKEYNSDDVLYNGNIEIKGRGNTTWKQPKKPYKIKLDSKSDLFGMGKNKHWVLLSNPIDTSGLRNDIAYKFSGKLGMNYQDGTWVELILNGEDVGLYYIAEHIRVGSTRTDITDWETVAEDAAKAIYKKNKDTIADKDELIDAMVEDLSWTTSGKFTFNNTEYKISKYYDVPEITGGYLLELTNIPEGAQFTTSKKVAIEVNTPETISKDMLKYISSYVQAFEDALYSDDFCTVYNGQKMRYTDFIDVDSFAKGVLLNDIFQNGDFAVRSTYFYKDIDGKLVYGPVWDMDWCFNNNADAWSSQSKAWVSRLFQDPVFMKAMRDIYWSHRYTDIYDIIKEGGTIDTAYNKIHEAALHDDEIWDNDVKFEENVADYKFRLQNKLLWLDATLATLESSSTFPATSKSDNIKLSYNNGLLNITTMNMNPTSYAVYINGEFYQEILASSELNNISVEATDDDIISVVAYSETTPVGGNYLYSKNYLTSLSITNKPNKTVYAAGDNIDLTGLELTAKYKDGSTKTVVPDMVYSKVTDSLDAQVYRYDKITDKCGSAVLVVAYDTKSIVIPITVKSREDYALVEQYINKIPANSEDINFVKYTAEAWEQYEALSDSAKAKVYNYKTLNSAIDVLESKANESMIIDCYWAAAMRNTARSNLIIAAKAGANAIICTLQGSASQTTFKNNSSENRVLGIKRLGNIEFWTVRRGLDLNYSSLTATARYGVAGDLYSIVKPMAQLITPEKAISNVEYPKCILANKDYIVTMNASKSVSAFKLMEGNSIITETPHLNGGIAFRFNSAGNHKVTLYYMVDGKWFEYKTVVIYVREEIEKNQIFYEENNNDSVKVITDDSFNKISFASEYDNAKLDSKTINDYRVWTGNINSDNKYEMLIDDFDSLSVIAPKKTVYLLGEEFVSDGMSVSALKDNTATVISSDEYTITPADMTKVGPQTISVYFHGLKASFEITIVDTSRIFNDNVSVDTEHNIIAGFKPGFKSLDEYLNAANGLSYNCTKYATDGIITVYKDDVIIDTYTILIYGDINGDGWYDSQDATIVKCLTLGSISTDALSVAAVKSADCNHDGIINDEDYDILVQAGIAISSVNQDSENPSLTEDSAYFDCINQSVNSDELSSSTPSVEKTNTEESEKQDDPIKVNRFHEIVSAIITAIIRIWNQIVNFFNQLFK